MNYYNEWDKPTAAWLQELINQGLIPNGHIDTRSIADVQPGDLDGYTQHHFFAGVAGWPLALQLAGWPTNRLVWTGSCPCQPFSAAGKHKGQDDERHVWPEFFRLIRECGPDAVFGEQVEGAVRLGWLDGVFADLEGEGYTCGAAVLGAHSAGAPHIRQRLYWVAHSSCERPSEFIGRWNESTRLAPTGRAGWLSNTNEPAVRGGSEPQPREARKQVAQQGHGPDSSNHPNHGDEVGSYWSEFDILPFIDGKARRIEPGTFPLVDGLPRGVVPSCDISESYAQATSEARVMRLKGYGNAIVPAVAAEFISAFMECSE